MRRLTLTEGAPAVEIDLSDEVAGALAEAELAAVSRVPGGRSWLATAGTKVGVVQVGELQVSVRPKIPIARLIFLMGYAQKPSYWRDHSVLLDASADLPEALAHAFARLATKALEQGLLQGYRLVDDSLAVVRGRIRVADQISRRYGRALPLEVTYDDFTVDIPENRLFLAAARTLLRVGQPTADVRRRLLRLETRLADVTPLRRGEAVPSWQPSRLNARYHAALRLAELILAGHSIEQHHGGVEVSGFVVDMWRVFENFVCVALREAMSSMGGAASLQHRMHLDEAGAVPMRPDYLWRGHDGRVIVADAKYKVEKPSGFPNADLYQLLAYCTVLGVPAGHLIYARGEGDATSHDVVGSDVVIHGHTLDLDLPPAELLEQMSRLGAVLGLPS